MNKLQQELLAFGWLRVSTPEQRDYGSSLKSQRIDIEAAAKKHGARIVEWYGGQEHATPGHERAEFDRMITDGVAVKIGGIFAASSDRFGRNTESGEKAQRLLRKHNIRLYFGSALQDLNSGTVRTALTLQTKIAEISTDERLDRSVKVRIEQAAMGFVTSSLPPYGRRVPATLLGTKRDWEKNPDGTAKWVVDAEARRYAQRAAQLYLRSPNWLAVAQALGSDENTVRRRVLQAGGQWQQCFRLRDGQKREDFASIPFCERLSFEGDYVTVTIPVPPLLDDVTIARVQAKAAARYANYRARNKQVLGGYLRCANSGGSVGTHFHAQTGAVYLQRNGPLLPDCPANFGRYEPVERSFFRRVGVMLRDPMELEAAVREAVLEETTRQPKLQHELQAERAAYATLKKEHQGLYAKVIAFDPEEGGATMLRLKADIGRLDAQLRAKAEQIREREGALKVTRLPEDFSERVAFTLFCLRGYGTNNRWLWTWPSAQKREMVQFLFGHQSRKPPKGSKEVGAQTGIYLERKIDERSGKAVIIWTAKGWFPQVSDEVWLDPKVTACIRPVGEGGGIDRKRLVQLIRRLDIKQFRLARLMFNADKLEGTRARS